MHTLEALRTSQEAAAGVAAGLVALVTVLLVGRRFRTAAGVAVAGAAVGLAPAGSGLAGAGIVALSAAALGPGVLAVAGVLAIAGALVPLGWVTAALVVGGVLLAAPAAPATASARGDRITAALLGVTVAAVFLAVPDTEGILLLGPGLVVVLATVALGAAPRLDRARWLAPVAAVLWAVGAGSAARPSTVVAGGCCLGIVLVEPVVRRVPPPSWRLGAAAGAAVLVGGQVAAGGIASRVAAPAGGMRSVAASAAALLVAALVAWACPPPQEGRTSR